MEGLAEEIVCEEFIPGVSNDCVITYYARLIYTGFTGAWNLIYGTHT